MTEISEEIQKRTDPFHERVARKVVEVSDKSPLEKAEFFADEGLPGYTADFLKIAEGVSDERKAELLAKAQEGAAARTQSIGNTLKGHIGTDAGYSKQAQNERSQVAEIRKSGKA